MTSDERVNPLVVRYPDRAHRMSEGIRQAWTDYGLDCLDRWMAFRFLDGSTDARLYDNKGEAVRFQKREEECCYLPVPPSMGVRECDAYLRVHEELYRGGLRISDPDRPIHMEMSTQRGEEWHNHGLITPRFRQTNPRNS